MFNNWFSPRLSATGALLPGLASIVNVIATLGDLERFTGPAVGNVYTLPPGIYLVVNPIQVGANTVLVSGYTVLTGVGQASGFFSSAAAQALVTELGSNVELENIAIYNTVGPAMQNQGNTLARRSLIETEGTQIALECLTGNWMGWANTITSQGVSFAVRHWEGDFLDDSSVCQAGATCFDNRETAALLRLTNTRLIGGQNGIRYRGLRGELLNCNISMGVDSAGGIVVLNGAQDLTVTGGEVSSNAVGTDRRGLFVFSTTNADLTITLDGVTFRDFNIGILSTSVTPPGTFLGTNLNMGVDVPIGVSWNNGIVPTNGFSLSTSSLLGATPFDGFSAASAGYNIKGCLGAGGPLPETAIVV